MRILVVDDSSLQRLDIVRALEPLHPAEIVEADNGFAALEQILFGRFDVMTVDYEMPDIRGDQLISYLRRVAPALPIVALTASQDSQVVHALQLAGACCVLRKPCRAEALREEVKKALYSV